MMKSLRDIGLIARIDHILHIALDLAEGIAVMRAMYHILHMYQALEVQEVQVEVQALRHRHMVVIAITVTMLLIQMSAIIMLPHLQLFQENSMRYCLVPEFQIRLLRKYPEPVL